MKETIDCLKIYANRQIILNHYEEDELIGKEGFHFDTLNVSPDRLEVLKDQRAVASIELSEGYEINKLPVFPRHYELVWPGKRIELYFP